MQDDALAAVYAFVESAYLRLQALDVLTHCLEIGDPDPMHDLVEDLVFDGPQSLNALREILSEIGARRTQLLDDQHEVFSQLDDKLFPYGIRLGEKFTPASLSRLTPVVFLALVRQQGVRREQDQLACVQILQDSFPMIHSLSDNLQLLDEIAIFLQDWMWGLIYQSARQVNDLNLGMWNDGLPQ